MEVGVLDEDHRCVDCAARGHRGFVEVDGNGLPLEFADGSAAGRR